MVLVLTLKEIPQYLSFKIVPSTPVILMSIITVQITFIFIDFRVCDFAFALKTQNAPCVSRFKRILFSDRFQFAFKTQTRRSFDL